MTAQASTATISREVEWVDTDASGHQHNSLIVRLVESAERELMARAGIVAEYFPHAPRVRQEVNFTAKLYFGQTVTTHVTVEHLGRASITLGFEVWGEPFGDVPRRRAAHGTVIAAHVPHGTEAATAWPAVITTALIPRHRTTP